jgi:hypothetical protein
MFFFVENLNSNISYVYGMQLLIGRAICTVGWVDIGTRTKVPLKFVTYLSKITKINEKSVLTQ